MIKAALVQERAEAVKPAMANTKRVLAIRAINIPAPVPATPAAPAPLAAENIPNAIVQVIIVGMVAVVFCLVIRATNTLAPAPATRVVPAPFAAANIPPAPVPAAMNGKTEVARNKFSTVPKVICIIVTVQWLVLRLAIWASMSR